jgi:leucyl aminopeptidase
MRVKVEIGDITASMADAVVVNLFEGVTVPSGATGAVDQALGGLLSNLIAAGDLRGKWGEFTLVHTQGKLPSPRVVVAGLGKANEFHVDRARELAGNLARYLRRLRLRSAATIAHGAGIAGLDPAVCSEAIAEGTALGLYRFLRHKRPEDEGPDFEDLTIVERDGSRVEAMQRGAERGAILAEATNACRDMANEPANYMTPSDMAAEAQRIAAESGLEFEVYGPDWIREKGMGSFLGVSAGSVQEPRFIVLRYNGNGDAAPLAFVGKGITFDTGGISIKPAENMGEMKGDMTGGAAVIAAIGALGKLRPKVNVMAVVPATENMPSGSATKPGDVLRAMSGKTIEVINTDAEGRLVLADALTYAREQGARALVDVATLTGAIGVTLGNVAMGAMGNDAALMAEVKEAAAAAGEKIWELPMFEEYHEQIESDVADMKNTGGRLAGSITAAMLLREFAEDTPWVHLDIAGVDVMDRERGVIAKGSSGIPTRTLVKLALAEAGEL